MHSSEALSRFDPAIASAIRGEEHRQTTTLSLIASENHTYPEVLFTSGTVLTDKYAEGYPGRRYYAGQEFYDVIETLAIERARQVFRAEHVNVQPLSGAPMNQAVFFGLLAPGDTILAMDLSHGGHLTHGSPVSHMGKVFRFVRYATCGPRGDIDFDQVRRLAIEHRPKLVLCGHSSYPREIEYARFKAIADEMGALTMADVSHVGGLIAGGVLDNPLDHGFDVLTTTTHKSLRGPRAGLIACKGQHGKRIDQSVFPGLQGGPHMHTIAGVAIALKKAGTAEFRDYCAGVLANSAELAHALIAHGAKLVSGGTENHLLVMDVVTSYGLDGQEAQENLAAIGLIANKQIIPDDARPAFRPSGIRLGTPAVTTRGLKPTHMRDIATWITECLRERTSPSDLRAAVESMSTRHPVPGIEAANLWS